MPDKTLRLDLDLYNRVARVAKEQHRSVRQQIEHYCWFMLDRDEGQLQDYKAVWKSYLKK